MRFTRTRYQNGSLVREGRKNGPVWVLRWREDLGGRIVRRKAIVGTVWEYRSKTAALKAAETLRLRINDEMWIPRTIDELVAHYTDKELPSKAHSTAGVHGSCIRARILPRWHDYLLSDVKTVAVNCHWQMVRRLK